MSILTRDQLNKLDNIISNMSNQVNISINGNLLEVNDMGMNYNLYSLISYIIGSVDYFNTIHAKSGIFNPNPINLSYLEDPINYGYINADLQNKEYIDNTNGDLYYEYIRSISDSVIEGWTIDLRPPIPYWFHDGTQPNFTWGNQNSYITTIRTTYPSWNGWPEYDSESVADKYPKNFNNIRIPVLFLSKCIQINNIGAASITYDQTINLESEQIINDSLWNDQNYEDIRIFRIIDTTSTPETDAGLKSASFEEIAREIDADNNLIKFSVSADNTFSIGVGESVNYIIYWRSPDIILADFDLPTYPGDNLASDYTIDEGNYYNYFYIYRHDLIEYSYNHPVLKSVGKTNYVSNEIDEKLYEPKDSIFYVLNNFDSHIDDFYDPQTSQSVNPVYYYRGLSTNYRDSLGNYPEYDSVFGIIVSIKSYYDMEQIANVIYNIQKGPNIYPDCFTFDWNDYPYYPKLQKEYIPLLKIIVGQKNTNEISQNSPRSKIIHMEYTKSYGSRGINNIQFVNLIYGNINNILNYFQNLNYNNIFSNYIFSTYLTFLALDIDEIYNNKIPIDIFISHMKYILSGDASSLFDNKNLFRTLDVNYVNQNIISVDDDLKNKSLELSSNDSNLQPWYNALLYWRKPNDASHGEEHFEFGDGSNWVVSNARNTDTSRIFLQYFPGNLDYDDTISIYDPNDVNTIIQDRDDTSKTGLKLFDTRLLLASQFEIYFPRIDNSDETLNSINQDYTLKFNFIDNLNNKIAKEIFIPNANFYISDNEYQQRVNNGESVIGYLTPSLVWSDQKYQEYGEAYYMPNCKTGSSREIFTRVFDSDKPGVQTIDEAIASCEDSEDPDGNRFKGGKDAQDANIDIRDCISDIRDSEGIESVDLRTISNKAKGIDSMWLGVTKYTTSDPIWKNDYEYLGGDRDFDSESEEFLLKTRYGYRVDGLINYQSFDKNEVISSRTNFINTHLQEDTIIKSQNRNDIYNDVDYAFNGTNNKLSQTFTSDFSLLSNKILNVQCWLKRVGSANASIILKIYNLSSNLPFESILESSPIDFKSISEDGEWITFEFSSNSKIDYEINRYALVLFSIEDAFEIFSEHNKLIWYFSSDNTYVYGMTDIYTFISANVVSGATYIEVDDVSVFPDTPFFVVIAGDLYYVVSIEDNKLLFSDYDYQLDFDYLGNREYPEYTWYINLISKEYSSGIMVSLVNFIPLDPENRFYTKKLTDDAGVISGWLLPDYSNHDAAYRITASAFDVGPVEEIAFNEWFGDDIPDNSEKSIHVDSFYISGNSVEYDTDKTWIYHTSLNNQIIVNDIGNENVDPSAIQGFSWAGNADPPIKNSKILAGFNVSGNLSFPNQNNIRVSNQNKIDRYWAFSTDKLDVSDNIIILPQALKRNNGSLEYLPIYNNIFITIGLVRPNQTRKVINKVIYGYNNDYGIISEVVDDTTFIVESSSFSGIDYNRFTGKIFKIMTGLSSGSEATISRCYDHDAIDNYKYRIEIISELKIAPEVGDEYVVVFSQRRMYDYGTLTDVSIDIETGFTTLTDDTKTWIDNSYNGYTIWLVDGNVPNTEVVVIDTLNSDQLLITNLLIDPSENTYYVILGDDESETGVYGTDAPIVLDNEKFIGVDHMYIDADNFPEDYNDGMGSTDAFVIRSKIDVSR